ncbi:MAG TPA: PRC-barrel domain-containing protein [Candidatus Methanomethylophilaceae archaeon]|nr:PRC-barrel domain-containing protein [Candidatus Methanomethylophilaceae archaeon]
MKNTKFFSRELIGKTVETVTGSRVGILDDVVVDTVDGRVKYLLIKPTESVISGQAKVDEEGRLVVETSRIRLENGKMVIN